MLEVITLEMNNLHKRVFQQDRKFLGGSQKNVQTLTEFSKILGKISGYMRKTPFYHKFCEK